MFGLSQKERDNKKQKERDQMVNQFQEELGEMLLEINSQSDRTGFYASYNGGGYDGADTLHNVYCDFGYPNQLDFSNFWNMYRRFGVASAVVNMPPDICWLSPPTVMGSEQFNTDFSALVKKTRLWNRLKGLDKRQRVGRYAGLFIQISDGKQLNQPVESLNGIGNIVNLKPIYEGQLTVATTESDQTKENFGEPTMYDYNSGGTGNRNDETKVSAQIHPDRLIIAAEGADDGSIYGLSSLENIYNDLMDLRKVSGAGGEGFYQNTRNAPVITTKDGYKAPTKPQDKKKLEKELDDFLGKWQKKFVSQGLEFNFPNIKLDNPKEFAENSWNNISAGCGIATNELRGAQTGVLAGDKDNKSTLTKMQSRRENFLDELVTDLIDWMLLRKVLPASPYEIIWDDLLASSEDEKLSLGERMASTNEKSFRSGQGAVYTEDEIRQASGYEPLTEEIPDESLTEDDLEPENAE